MMAHTQHKPILLQESKKFFRRDLVMACHTPPLKYYLHRRPFCFISASLFVHENKACLQCRVTHFLHRVQCSMYSFCSTSTLIALPPGLHSLQQAKKKNIQVNSNYLQHHKYWRLQKLASSTTTTDRNLTESNTRERDFKQESPQQLTPQKWNRTQTQKWQTHTNVNVPSIPSPQK